MRLIIFAFITTLAVSSCSEELELFDPYAKPFPVIYALINPYDTIHFIRLTKSYCGSSDAFQMARDTDKLFYDSISVQLVCLKEDLSVFRRISFSKVYFHPPDNGIFSTPASWYYRAIEKLPVRDSFLFMRIECFIYDSMDSISTGLVYYLDQTRITKPSKSSRTISLYPSEPTPIEGEGYSFYGFKIRFNYRDFSNGLYVDRNIEKFFSAKNGVFFLSPEKFLRMVSDQIQEVDSVDYRVPMSVDIFSYSTGIEVFDYNKLYQYPLDINTIPSQLIHGGMGLFASYSKDSLFGLVLDQKSSDSLASSSITRHLGFIRW